MNVQEKLFELKDNEYALFQARLIPTINRDNIIGVRVPILRKLAKEYIKTDEVTYFLDTLPHKYYDEFMLHGLLLSELKDYQECIDKVDKFLPYVDNWAVCDIMSPKIFRKNKEKLLIKIKEWTKSSKTYTCRFGIEMLMTHFLDKDFKKEYLEIPAQVKSDEYYIKMMIAWFYATALAKHWDEAIIYLEKNSLSTWVHNKTIQKARESLRISKEQKEYLKTLKR